MILFRRRPLRRAAGGHIGLAERREDGVGEARPVVGDGYGYPVGGPSGHDIDRAACEIDGVFNQVGQAIDHAWPALGHRFLSGFAIQTWCRSGRDPDLLFEYPVWLDR